MPILPFGEWKPDLMNTNGDSSQLVQNVVPRADGYGPFGSFLPFSGPLAEGNDSFTKVLLHFDGADASTTFTDNNAGGSVHTWTAAGNAQIDTADFKFNGASGLFDGTGDWITTPDHADFALGTSDFTIDFWFKCNAAGGSVLFIAGQNDAAFTAGNVSFYIIRQNTNVIQAFVWSGGAQTGVGGTTQFTNALNPGWHHVAFVRTGNALKLFIDGVQEGGNASFAGSVNDSPAVLGVGTAGALTASSFNGWLDEFRLSVGIARWTANFLPPGKAYDVDPNGRCRGHFYARKTDGSVVVFAGTSTRLFKLNNTDFSWTDVSKGALAYPALSSFEHWQFAQFGNFVVAVQANTVPQVFDISSGSAFADLGGSPPQARYVAVVGRFLVLSGLLSTPYRIQWSGLNAITTWTPGVSSSDFQDFPDGGIVRGVAGGEFGVIFQDSVIRRMVFAVGAPYVFQIDRIAEDKGLLAPYSLIRAGDKIFFLASQGFHEMLATGAPVPIGKEKFDRTFFGDYDSSQLQLIIGAADPEQSRVYWAYKSMAGQAGLFDKVVCYDYALGRATVIALTGEYLATLARPGLTLDSLDTISGSIEALPFSLDDVSIAALPKLALFSSAHRLGFCTGPALEATLDTAEQMLDGAGAGRRVRVKGLRPLTDAAACYGSVGARETNQAAVAYSTEQAVNGKGLCPANVSTRLARGRLRIPTGTVWTYASGFEPDFVQEGRR
jgi:Concanavalin A-like lectin/glucanases superfamily